MVWLANQRGAGGRRGAGRGEGRNEREENGTGGRGRCSVGETASHKIAESSTPHMSSAREVPTNPYENELLANAEARLRVKLWTGSPVAYIMS